MNNPGSFSCKAVFIVESNVKRCWLTRGIEIIAEQTVIELSRVQVDL